MSLSPCSDSLPSESNRFHYIQRKKIIEGFPSITKTKTVALQNLEQEIQEAIASQSDSSPETNQLLSLVTKDKKTSLLRTILDLTLRKMAPENGPNGLFLLRKLLELVREEEGYIVYQSRWTVAVLTGDAAGLKKLFEKNSFSIHRLTKAHRWCKINGLTAAADLLSNKMVAQII